MPSKICYLIFCSRYWRSEIWYLRLKTQKRKRQNPPLPKDNKSCRCRNNNYTLAKAFSLPDRHMVSKNKLKTKIASGFSKKLTENNVNKINLPQKTAHRSF